MTLQISDNDTLICLFCEQSFPENDPDSLMVSGWDGHGEFHACGRCVAEGKLTEDFSNLIQKDKPLH